MSRGLGTMRWIAILIVGLTSAQTCAAAPLDGFGRKLEGPWGRVDVNWQPYIGVLAKNSCPAAGIKHPSSVGLFGEGGAMWIEAEASGALKLHDGSIMRLLTLVRMETATSAVYSDLGAERRWSLVGADRLSEEKLPAIAGVPPAHYVRCKKKKP